MRVFGFASALAVVSAIGLVQACSSSPGARPGVETESPIATGGSGGSSSSSTQTEDAGEDAGQDSSSSLATFSISGTIVDPSGNALANVSVCVLGSTTACATTSATGAFSLAGIPESQSGISASLSGYVTTLYPLMATGPVTAFSGTLLTSAGVSAAATGTGAAFDTTHGGISFDVTDGTGAALVGATVTTVPAGTVGYLNSAGNAIDSSATSTVNGAGYVFGLTPQTVQVNVLDTGHTCTLGAGFGWTSTTGTLTAPVIANELTLVSATCQ